MSLLYGAGNGDGIVKIIGGGGYKYVNSVTQSHTQQLVLVIRYRTCLTFDDICCLLAKYTALYIYALQNMGLKAVLKADRLASTAAIHDEMNIPFLETRCAIHSAVEMYKVHTNQAPPREMFERYDKQSCTVTRQQTKGDFKLPHCRLEFGKRNFRFRGPKIWSCVQSETRQAKTSKGFK